MCLGGAGCTAQSALPTLVLDARHDAGRVVDSHMVLQVNLGIGLPATLLTLSGNGYVLTAMHSGLHNLIPYGIFAFPAFF